jgi:hypothetical protein
MSTSMDRLVRARPPAAAMADRDGLFARIVAQPQEPAPARAPRSAQRRVAIACVAVALLGLTAGTALAVTRLLGWHTDTTIVDQPRQWQKLYHAATLKLTLPPGEHWPARTLPRNTVTARTQPGALAVGISQVAWECYWADAIRTGDAAAGRQAHAALDDLVAHHIVVAPPGSPENVAPPAGTEQPFAIYASDGGIQFVRRSYAQAAAGHPKLLDQSCRANGPPPPR